MRPDDLPRDEVVDTVLARLVAGLPADRALDGDEAFITRGVDAALARRAAAATANAGSPPGRTSFTRVALAVASVALVGVAVTTVVSRPGEPAPAPQVGALATPTSEAAPSSPPSFSLPPPLSPSSAAATNSIPAIDISALPTVPSVKVPASAAPREPSTRGRTAAELFALANDARRRRDPSAAELYRDLEVSFPASPEAVTAYVTLGRLELDRGHASAALAQFDAYLATNAGELREDALVGRAGALEALGRETDERRAWEALLSAYPQTLLAPHAKARLASLHVH